MNADKKPGRGRPKGSKNKFHHTGDNGDVTNLPTPGGRGRGRPSEKKNQGDMKMYQQSNHEYTELAKTAVSNTNLYNLYGVVIDSSTPHKKDHQSGYKTYIKIIDPSLYGTDKDQSASQAVTITFLSTTIENLPIFKKIGEIIRIHRCNIGTYK